MRGVARVNAETVALRSKETLRRKQALLISGHGTGRTRPDAGAAKRFRSACAYTVRLRLSDADKLGFRKHRQGVTRHANG